MKAFTRILYFSYAYVAYAGIALMLLFSAAVGSGVGGESIYETFNSFFFWLTLLQGVGLAVLCARVRRASDWSRLSWFACVAALFWLMSAVISFIAVWNSVQDPQLADQGWDAIANGQYNGSLGMNLDMSFISVVLCAGIAVHAYWLGRKK